MWTWLSRVFGSTRAAERAEAEGRVDDAVRLYLDAGDRVEALRLLLRMGEVAPTLDERRRFYTRAFGIARSDEQQDDARRGLARVSLAEAEARAPRDEEERRRLVEAARELEGFGEFRDAARAYELLGDRDAVVRVLTLSGDVDALEQVAGDREQADRKALRRRAVLEGFDASWRSGDRGRALDELRHWVAQEPDDHEARQALDGREETLLREGRCTMTVGGRQTVLLSRFPCTLGREGDVVLRGGSVSRKHATLDRAGAVWRVTDAGSRAGTLIDGVPIAGTLGLTEGLTVHLGQDVVLRVGAPDGANLALDVERGLDRGRRVVLLGDAWRSPFGAVRFGARGPVLEPSGAVQLNGQKVAMSVLLTRGDRIEGVDESMTVSP